MGVTRILKYPVQGEGFVTSITCRRNKILDIQLQDGRMMCWIETRDNLPEVTTKLLSVGTGWEMPYEVMKDATYVKTVQDASGYVWHFYEMQKEIEVNI